jgi:type II secretory pathway pseudopilin PulG
MPTGRAARRGEAGYTLAVLVGIVTVLAIALAAAAPHWAARVQRAKEAELVARGLQYAEAIRVFQRRFGRLPNTLQELVDVEPRSIRQLWKNPFSSSGVGGWVLLMVVGGQVAPIDPLTGAVVGGAPAADEPGDGNVGAEVASPSPRPPNAPGGFTRGVAVAGPIHGVKSLFRGEAYLSFFDQKDYGDWEFSVERLVAATAATTPEGLLRRADYASIGRAFPFAPPGGVPGAGAAPPVPAQGSAPGDPPKPPRRGARPAEVDEGER